jgi:hypothetical protein
MTIEHDLARALAPFSDGKPDAPQNARTRRMAAILDTVIALLGDDYAYGSVWDEFPRACYVTFNVSKREPDGCITYMLMSESHRDLHYLSDVALIALWQYSIPCSFSAKSKGPAMKSEDNGCL